MDRGKVKAAEVTGAKGSYDESDFQPYEDGAE
jgi:hypothetical protein